jgi:hypothetical protein
MPVRERKSVEHPAKQARGAVKTGDSEVVTADELMAEYSRLAKLVPAGPEGHTTRELEVAWGMTRPSTMAVLHKLNAAGLVSACRGRRRNLVGEWQSVPVYTLKRR